jgi:hypothetical protein
MDQPHYFPHVLMFSKGWYGNPHELDTVNKIVCHLCALEKISEKDLFYIITSSFEYANYVLISKGAYVSRNMYEEVLKDTFFPISVFSRNENVPKHKVMMEVMISKMAQIEKKYFPEEVFYFHIKIADLFPNYDEMRKKAEDFGLTIKWN